MENEYYGIYLDDGLPPPSVEETRRQLFETWYFVHVQQSIGVEDSPEEMKLRRGVDGNYSEYPAIKHKWEGFNAALDSVEIELPEKRCIKDADDMYEVARNGTINECRVSVESLNLGIKIK